MALISLLETLLAARVVDELKCEELCVFFDDEPRAEPIAPTRATGEGGGMAADEASLGGASRLLSEVPTTSALALAAANGESALLGGIADPNPDRDCEPDLITDPGSSADPIADPEPDPNPGASALLGGIGGCGLIPQTVLNVNAGGGGRVSSAAYATAMATMVLVFAPLVGQISQAALAGLMITVAYSTVQWKPTADILLAALPASSASDAAADGTGAGAPPGFIGGRRGSQD